LNLDLVLETAIPLILLLAPIVSLVASLYITRVCRELDTLLKVQQAKPRRRTRVNAAQLSLPGFTDPPVFTPAQVAAVTKQAEPADKAEVHDLQNDVKTLLEHYGQAKRGDVITYRAIADLLGIECQSGYWYRVTALFVQRMGNTLNLMLARNRNSRHFVIVSTLEELAAVNRGIGKCVDTLDRHLNAVRQHIPDDTLPEAEQQLVTKLRAAADTIAPAIREARDAATRPTIRTVTEET
jgi:hypothetical protein